MTKHYYEMIAKAIAETCGETRFKIILVQKLCVKFEAHNPRFCKERFKDACGLEDYDWKVNLMSGKDYLEEKRTPACCSPARETYWSM